MRSWQRWLLILGFVAALALTLVFAARAVEHVRPLRQRPDPPMRAWMTVPFVAHSYHVPAYVLYQALRLQPVRRDHRTIADVAQQHELTVAEVEALLRRAIVHARPPYPPPPSPPPPSAPDPRPGTR